MKFLTFNLGISIPTMLNYAIQRKEYPMLTLLRRDLQVIMELKKGKDYVNLEGVF